MAARCRACQHGTLFVPDLYDREFARVSKAEHLSRNPLPPTDRPTSGAVVVVAIVDLILAEDVDYPTPSPKCQFPGAFESQAQSPPGEKTPDSAFDDDEEVANISAARRTRRRCSNESSKQGRGWSINEIVCHREPLDRGPRLVAPDARGGDAASVVDSDSRLRSIDRSIV